ncbi:MAG: ABC transporter ATP-binding protein/permease [Alicyclobacillus sp.]|nr:ABC transporter ATP-binding protein/permease [Alicyclobacillus sp.]
MSETKVFGQLNDAELRSPFIYKDDDVLEKKFQWQQMRRLMKYMLAFPRLMAGAMVAMIGGIAVSLCAPYIIGHAIDVAIAGHHLHQVVLYAATLAAIYIVNFVASRYRIHFTNVLGQSVIRRLRQELFGHVQGLSFDFFDKRPAGSVLVRIMNDVNSLQDLFTNGVINSITNMFTLVGIVIIMLSLNWRLGLVTMVIVPIMFLLSTKLRVLIRRAWQSVRIRSSRINAHLNESLQGVRVTQAYVRQHHNQVFFNDMNLEFVRHFRRATGLSAIFGPMVDFTGSVGSALLFVAGVYMLKFHISGITVGLLVAFANYLGNFWTPISQLGQVYNQLLVAMASSERIFEYLDTRPSVANRVGAKPLPPIRGDVEFDHVSFEYGRGTKALDDVNFKVSAGETVALVGHTGAGKSTVINLLARFYEPTEGVIRIDGHDICAADLQSLRSQIGIVLQDTFIFSGTIMDNIRYGKPDATDEEVIAAACAVYADEFIRGLENGYHTEVRERGSRLSMGQRQLLSFARAILADPKILILDEATASIDTHTEHLIQMGLKTLLANRTSFVVAHRLSTIREADQILVFQEGRIVERGNHASLMKSNGYYHDLVRAQYRFMA